MFFLLLIVFGIPVQTGAESPSCSCPDSKINHVSAISFGMTLLSPSFSSRYFNISSQNGIVIRQPSEPIWFANKKYYWDNEYYKAGQEHSTVCSYHISYYHKELRKIKYNNTQRPSNITFGCHWYHECCDLGCCTNSVVQIVIYIFLYTGIGIMLISFCAQLPTETEEERRTRRARAELGVFFPCQRNPEPEPIENYVLREIVNREGPPKYDDLYPKESSFTRPHRNPNQQPQTSLHTIEESEVSDTA